MKMPAPAGVITVRGDQQLARDIERGYTPGQKNVHNLRTESKPESFEEQQRDSEKATFEEDCEVKKVPLDVHLLDKMVTINTTLEPEEEKELLEFLRKNQDVFAWSASDLRGAAEISLIIAWTSTQTSSQRSRSFTKWKRKKSQKSRPKSRDC